MVTDALLELPKSLMVWYTEPLYGKARKERGADSEKILMSHSLLDFPLKILRKSVCLPKTEPVLKTGH